MRQRFEARRAAMGSGSSGAGNGAQGGGAAPDPAMIAEFRERMRRMLREALAPFRDTLDETQRARWDSEMELLANARRVTLYTLKDGKPSAVTVRAGVSDGSHTEVLGDGIEAGAEVIVGAGTPTP